MSPTERQKIFYFCDETSHTPGDDFMAVGGIAINLSRLAEIERQIVTLREALSIKGEVKWNNAKPRRNSSQKAYADLLRQLVEDNRVHLHIRFQRTGDYDHRLSGSRRKTDTVSKAHYQLIAHRPVAFYGKNCDLHIRPDDGECTELLPSYLGHLNSEGRKFHKVGIDCVASIHPTNSRRSHPLQLLDVTLGAFSCLRNRRHERGDLKETKVELARYVHALWEGIDLSISHRPDARKFNVWNVRPSLGERGPQGLALAGAAGVTYGFEPQGPLEPMAPEPRRQQMRQSVGTDQPTVRSNERPNVVSFGGAVWATHAPQGMSAASRSYWHGSLLDQRRVAAGVWADAILAEVAQLGTKSVPRAVKLAG